jgi:hypothetical protein
MSGENKETEDRDCQGERGKKKVLEECRDRQGDTGNKRI